MQIKIVADSRNRQQLNIIVNGAKKTKEAVRRALWITGLDLAGNGSRNSGIIKQEMLKPKKGKQYNYGQASAPGESPGIKGGDLINSVYKRAAGYDEIEIGADTPYARILEKGGMAGRNNKVKIARRNFIIRPILNHRRKIIMNFSRELDKLLK